MSLKRIILKNTSKLTDLLYPPICISCDKPLLWDSDKFICTDCITGITCIGDNSCWFCATPQGKYATRPKDCPECRGHDYAFTRVIAACTYSGVAKDMIHAFKFQNMKNISTLILQFLIQKFENEYKDIRFDYIIPVPLHKRRLQERGYNQSAILAEELSRLTGYPFAADILQRVRYTESQALLCADARRINLNRAFRVNSELNKATVLLVDDVLTTGSTLHECAKILRKHGARRIYALVFAR